MLNAKTASTPWIEYRVETQCGRIFGWSATDYYDLFNRLTERGYQAKKVQLWSDFESEQAALYKAIEKARKAG